MNLDISKFLTERQKREQTEDHFKRVIKDNHKCGKCVWGKWQSNEKVICTFSRCMKDEI